MISVRTARIVAVEAIVRLINTAFLVERFFVDGDRANSEKVRSLMEKGKFLLVDDGPSLAGCVYVEPRGERGYIGLPSVDPALQRSDLGRQLVAAAEDFFRAAGCRFSDLRIVNVREELPAFYRKLGYAETGTSQFVGDAPPKVPAHFITMSKPLA
jgi:ribosomal protein S18 acetylase RimI-like enzyme